MCPHVSRLLTELQASESWRESEHGAKIGEETSLSGM